MAGNEVTLPALRQDLKLFKAAPDEDGCPRWQLYDPMNSRYFYFSSIAMTIFRHWKDGASISDLIHSLPSDNHLTAVQADDVHAFLHFLQQNNLTRADTIADARQISQRHTANQKGIFSWLLHNYLFIKIPLFRPDSFLNRVYPGLSWLFRPWVSILFITLGLTGLFMVMRQWSEFVHSFEYFFSWKGLAAYGCALVFIKSAHELGHALVARRYHCRVSSMGIAFLVLFPILYTDTTDAWKLRSKYQRLNIVTAGVRVELYLAMLSTFLWVIVPDGSFRSVLFFIATTSWVSSLIINTSPFMRFDGYYAMSDLTGIENLQPRAFAVGRWYLRRIILGLDQEPPEPLNRRKRLFFVAYAWGTWIYRFMLFLGIALLVYHFTIKLLGILLFSVEILWFILLPVWREIAVWWSVKHKIRKNPSIIISTALLATVFLLIILPWQQSISAPAILKAARHQSIFPPETGRIIHWAISTGQKVTTGQTLLAIESPELNQKIAESQLKMDLFSERLRRIASSDYERKSVQILQQAMIQEQNKLALLLERQDRLIIKAPFSGVITNTSPLKPGAYISADTMLFSITDLSGATLHAFVAARDINAVKPGSSGIFTSTEGAHYSNFRLDRILPFASEQLPYPELASVYGGNIGARDKDSRLIPESPVHEVILSADTAVDFMHRESGEVKLEGQPQSLLSRFWQKAYSVFIRESGF